MKKMILSIIVFLMIIVCLSIYQDLKRNTDIKNDDQKKEKINEMKIKIINNEYEIIFLLNNSKASEALYNQLPLELDIENYSHNEKICYPPQPLDTAETPLLQKGSTGTLGYFSPWGNVVMYYGECSSYNGLYVLGEAIKGSEYIKGLSGKVIIEKEN
jgi:Uncharacterized conserved protein